MGGTSVLYISDVELDTAGWPDSLTDRAVPALANTVLSTVPATFVTVGAAMAGIHWVVRRRQKLAAETLPDDDTANATTPAVDETGADTGSDS